MSSKRGILSIGSVAVAVIALLMPFAATAQKFTTPKSHSTSTVDPNNTSGGAVIEQKISAWEALTPLGTRVEAPVDTNFIDYSLRSVPSHVSPAWATTGNYGAEGINLLYMQRKRTSPFFFLDALQAWFPAPDNMLFYNSRIPVTFLSYNFGGGNDSGQDHLRGVFSGNINRRAQVGAMADYIYSKGSYNYQADKDFTWGFSGSYIGDRYEFQGYYYHYNFVNKENGGITDDRYITDPASIQGGNTSVDYKTIPTNLTDAHNRVAGGRLFLNNRYKLGFWRELPMQEGDTIIREEFVPVTSFIWTLDYTNARHTFRNSQSRQDNDFWDDTYISAGKTNDFTTYWSLRNTIGVALLEGFNKYAQAGLTAYVTHEYRVYKQTPDTLVDRTQPLPDGLSPLPFEGAAPTGVKQNRMWVGAQIAREKGRILNYRASAEIGFLGSAAGEVKIDGDISTKIPLRGDSLRIKAYGRFYNTNVPYLLKHYVSNHFAWDNDFGRERRVRFGGSVSFPRTSTRIDVGVENVQNLVYFGPEGTPVQHGGNVQVFSATLRQDFRVGVLNWQNSITYQKSANSTVIPLPELVVRSNLFVNFKMFRVLDVQFGVDCDYYTRYKALAYQPATMSFYNQDEVMCGNYPFMNLYLNMKLSKTRFYVMFSHINQGLIGGNNFFSLPHYPLNPRRFQLGLSIDFAN